MLFPEYTKSALTLFARNNTKSCVKISSAFYYIILVLVLVFYLYTLSQIELCYIWHDVWRITPSISSNWLSESQVE